MGQSKKKVDFLTFSACTDELARSTSLHGLRHAGWAQSCCGKFLWTLITLIGLGLFITLVVLMAIHYFEYPFVTRMHSEVGFFTFPAVTICNTNPVKLSKVGNILDPLYVDKLDGHYTLNYSVNNMIDPFAQARYDFEAVCCKYPEMRTFLEQTISAYNYLQRVSLGHTLQDLVLFCAYNGRQCDFDNDFSPAVWNNYYGSCFTFGGQKPDRDTGVPTNIHTVAGAGENDGLVIIFDTQSWDHIARITEEKGARVLIHSPGEMPFPHIQGLSIPGGFEAKINVALHHTSRVTIPAGSCMTASMNDYGYSYSDTACQEVCKQEAAYEHCLCVSPANQVDNFTTTCTLNDLCMLGEGKHCVAEMGGCADSPQYACYTNVMNKFQSGELVCTCPPLCEDDKYTVEYSLAQWPADQYTDEDYWCQATGYVDYNSTALATLTNRTACLELVLNYFCGCRENVRFKNISTSFYLYPNISAMLPCATNVELTCQNAITNQVMNGKISCNCAGGLNKPHYVTDIIDELTRAELLWNNTGRKPLAISRTPNDRVSIKVYSSVIGRDVYVQEATYTVCVHEGARALLVQLLSFLTDIGGVATLFIGASLLTVLEFVEWLVTMFLIPCINFPPWLDEEELKRRHRERMAAERQEELYQQAASYARPGTSASYSNVHPMVDEINERPLPKKNIDDERKPITAT